jgi:hypothetical protein
MKVICSWTRGSTEPEASGRCCSWWRQGTQSISADFRRPTSSKFQDDSMPTGVSSQRNSAILTRIKTSNPHTHPQAQPQTQEKHDAVDSLLREHTRMSCSAGW